MGVAPSKPFEYERPQDRIRRVKRGEDITLIWDSNVGVYFKWKKEGQLLENNGRINITQSNDYKTLKLVIKDARERDEGIYTLDVWNRKGNSSGSIEVKLLEFDNDWRTIQWGENDKVIKFLREFKPCKEETAYLRFLLNGPIGAGKSSIINSINSVFQGHVSVTASADATSGKSHTKFYRTHTIKDQRGNKLPFVFNDIMGLENTENGGALSADIISALQGHIRENYKFNPGSPLSAGDNYYNSSPELKEKAHCLVSVIPANKIALLDDKDGVIVKMRDIREEASDLGIPQVVFMTHVDTCCKLVKEDLTHVYSSKKISEAMQHCSNKLGVPMNCIFPVKNYSMTTTVDGNTDSLILDALQTIVLYANDYVDNL